MTNIQKFLIGVVIIVVLIVSVGYITQQQSKTLAPNMQQFTDTTYGVTFAYPKNLELITDKAVLATTGYFPTCNNETSIACIFVASSTYPHSNFSNAGISINIPKNITSESDCYLLTNFEQSKLSDVTIHNRVYKAFGANDAAMSHQSVGIDYRTYYKNTCYEVTTRINTTSFDVYEAGLIDRFTDTQKQELVFTLSSVLETIVLK